MGLSLAIILVFLSPMKQDPHYHEFADTCAHMGIFNFHNVFSNILFTVFSFLGFRHYLHDKKGRGISWLVFLIGVFLVAPGSAYYHYNPTNQTLIWDRIPMTMAFMGLTAFAFTEVFQLKREWPVLLLFLAIGFYSIFHWIIFNDLRIYGWVQLTPILVYLYMAIFLPTPSLRPKYLGVAVLFYLLAKATEHNDLFIYNLLGYSGHSLKHILASFSVFSLIEMKKRY
jgi:hypothetical protein